MTDHKSTVDVDATLIQDAFRALQGEAYGNAKAHGFWPTSVNTPQTLAVEFLALQELGTRESRPEDAADLVLRIRETMPRTLAEQIALQHSELSEVLEADRHGNPPSTKIPGFSSIEEEYADLFIRCLDTCEARGYRLADAVLAKMRYNRGRPTKHGKAY